MITFGFKNKFNGLARALAAILIGVIMVAFPEKAVAIIVWIIAGILLVSGIVSLSYAIAHRNSGSVGLLSFNTVVNIILGVLLLIFPTQVATILMWLMGIALTMFGLFQIIALSSASNYIKLGFFTFLLPVLCTIGGIFVLYNAWKATAALTVICGVAVLIYGISDLISSWRMNKAWQEYEIKYPEKDASDSQTPFEDAKDAEFEKVDDEKAE